MPGRFVLFLCLALAGAHGAWAQETPTVTEDSLRSYDLEEVVVRASQVEPVSVSTLQSIDLARLVQTDAATADDLMRLVPAAHIQTNSRGETLVYLRAAGERQVALFFDGAFLNVPWDNRFDLALVPAGAIGGMTVSKGVPSMLYGTNVLGGAINLTSRRLGHRGAFTEATAQWGRPRSGKLLVTHLGRTERLGYALTAGYTAREGQALPGRAALPFNQVDDELRTNTDRRLFNVLGKVQYHASFGGDFGLTVLHLQGEKGVAPEGHLDPDRYRVRFWRYPHWRTSMIILNASLPAAGRPTSVRATFWGSDFAQTIRQYESVRYDRLVEEQRDTDLTLGSRFVVLRRLGSGEVRLALNALTSRHRQQNLEAASAGGGVDAGAPRQTYRQHIVSAGVENEWSMAPKLRLVVGGSIDGIATPRTGDKPAREPQFDYGLTSGASYDVAEGWRLRAVVGRKTRFPTMRELFGQALDRFLLNPDLGPETSLSAEVAVERRQTWWSTELIAFVRRTYDTIDQRSVQVPGEDRPRRQRINLDGSRVAGLELAAVARVRNHWSMHGHVSWMHARAHTPDGRRPLVEKPEWLGMLSLEYRNPTGFSAMVQPVLAGTAYGFGEDGRLSPLPSSLVWHARIGYQRFRERASRVYGLELFVRVNNVTDEMVLPQLGLPGPGREVHLGLNLAL